MTSTDKSKLNSGILGIPIHVERQLESQGLLEDILRILNIYSDAHSNDYKHVPFGKYFGILPSGWCEENNGLAWTVINNPTFRIFNGVFIYREEKNWHHIYHRFAVVNDTVIELTAINLNHQEFYYIGSEIDIKKEFEKQFGYDYDNADEDDLYDFDICLSIEYSEDYPMSASKATSEIKKMWKSLNE